jgi:hypothetical protein
MEKKADKPEELSSAAYCLAHCRSPSAPIERLQEKVKTVYQALRRLYILCRTPRASVSSSNYFDQRQVSARDRDGEDLTRELKAVGINLANRRGTPLFDTPTNQASTTKYQPTLLLLHLHHNGLEPGNGETDAI